MKLSVMISILILSCSSQRMKQDLTVLDLSNKNLKEIPRKALENSATKIHELPDSMKDLENLRLVIMFEVDLTDNEKNKIKCVLPSNCEIMFSKKYREYPPYKCD